ncbi:MAG: hydrolase [archaeon]|jgi:hypothetical protein
MEVCCPKFNPKPWNEKILVWKNKKFVKGKVFTFFYMPLNFGGVITNLMKKIGESGAKCLNNMGLSYHTSKWGMDLYLAVDKKVTGLENVTLSGKFASKVYEGPFEDTGKWGADFETYLKKKKLSMKKMFMWYTTCPKCAKKYGKNYVVIIAELK